MSRKQTVSVKVDGEEIATFKASSYKHSPESIEGAGDMPDIGPRSSLGVSATDDDDEGWRSLLPQSYEVEWHIGESVYKGSISRKEFMRMIDDGVLK